MHEQLGQRRDTSLDSDGRSNPPASPLVSIVINNYNYGRYLETAIRSALEQDHSPLEIIVVDDGSIDNSREIIAQFEGQIIAIFKKNGGQASALNAGISRARGEFILLLDADDYLLSNAISFCVNSFPSGYSHIYFRLDAVDAAGNNLESCNHRIPFIEFDGDAMIAVGRGTAFPSTVTSANFFRARVLKSIIPIPESEWRICADNFISIQSAACGPIRSVARTLGAYRFHGHNGWMARECLYTDPRRLGVHIDNHLRGRRLIARNCMRLGIEYPVTKLGDDFWLLHLLCAARKVDAPVSVDLLPRGSAILGACSRYIRLAKGGTAKKMANLLYLMLMLSAPTFVSARLLRARYAWEQRAFRQS